MLVLFPSLLHEIRGMVLTVLSAVMPPELSARMHASLLRRSEVSAPKRADRAASFLVMICLCMRS